MFQKDSKIMKRQLANLEKKRKRLLDKHTGRKKSRSPSPISKTFERRLSNVLNQREEHRENLQLEREIEELKTCTFTPMLTNTSRAICHQYRRKPIHRRYEEEERAK
jgi:hypothetical protein